MPPARRVSVASSLIRAPSRRRRENNLNFTPRPSASSFASRRASHRASSRRSSVPRLSTPSAPDNRLCGACAGRRRRRQSSVVVRFFEFHRHRRGRDRRRFVPCASRLATTKRAIAARKEPAGVVAPRASIALARARTLKRFPCNRRAMNDARRLLSCSVVLTRVFPHVCVLYLARGRARLPARAAVDGGGRARGGVARASRRERHGERDRSARQERARDGSAGARAVVRFGRGLEDGGVERARERSRARARERESERERRCARGD